MSARRERGPDFLAMVGDAVADQAAQVRADNAQLKERLRVAEGSALLLSKALLEPGQLTPGELQRAKSVARATIAAVEPTS